MELQNIGFTKDLENYILEENLVDFQIGRIIAEHKERYIIKDESGEYEAEITGNMRFSAISREDFPAVGDWVAFQLFGEDLGIIHHILPRKTILARQAVNKPGEKQIIASNIDVAFIVQAVDRDFNINRLERYLTICYTAKIDPVLILSKTDLISPNEVKERLDKLKSRNIKLEPILVSNHDLNDIEKLKSTIEKGKTYCFIGSSGVGKSTLINNLLGRKDLQTSSISTSTGKGKHTTSHKELFIIETGGILIDTPGMREIGLTEDDDGIEITFDKIAEMAENCKFKDCNHINENGCAVIQAVKSEVISKESYENYLKMQREQQRFSATIAEKRKKDKDFGKMIKSVLKEKKKNKF